MTSQQNNSKGKILISGASLAGPALAYWLHRAGFTVTVVEKASALRGGGYPIDLRGTAIEVVRRMGLLPQIRERRVELGRFTFLGADGGQVASLRPAAVTGSAENQDLEVGRGDLTALLYESVRDDVEFLFDDSIDALDESGGRVDVAFRSGVRRSFDLVVGADGMHSNTRKLLFGPEAQFHRYLGYAFAVFTMPNTLGLSHELMLWNVPGKGAALYATGSSDDRVHAFLNFHRPTQPVEVLRNPAAQRELVTQTYAGARWQVPALVEAMNRADDVFFDTAGQIRLPAWSKGRVVLVGDAAYAPSFLTGQGSSLALVGAYLLADALDSHSDHVKALAAYEEGMRDFVTINQALVDEGGARLFPTTEAALEQRNAGLRSLASMPPSAGLAAHSALTLPAMRIMA